MKKASCVCAHVRRTEAGVGVNREGAGWVAECWITRVRVRVRVGGECFDRHLVCQLLGLADSENR